ncbi:MAG: hypothetical protein CL807_06695 [Citromicrobium sp.]|uniref:Uncharacterized protein n=1 Tax=Sphingopyxis alaskensis (strain DSM 13593 / LMG 18877 / RB2256) TaxID=317655 RepID=Q1J405_SPHAL|nr:hypothetical protein Sala_3215 [Sphingopyxis alaskensis RB2256]MAK99017.1 hypothetical protein [Citromicrobium sp.]MAO95627.1 hypothetical protein [Citromicrobium sp.]MBD75342.1 hypothetical protein [Citromicrobium sp.]MBD76565.1 hypothetical protein [Citromicrobium sp.]
MPHLGGTAHGIKIVILPYRGMASFFSFSAQTGRSETGPDSAISGGQVRQEMNFSLYANSKSATVAIAADSEFDSREIRHRWHRNPSSHALIRARLAQYQANAE